MEAAAHPYTDHEMPTSGGALTSVALSSTLHCLTGFETEFPTAARYRLFVQFKHGGAVHTAASTHEVVR